MGPGVIMLFRRLPCGERMRHRRFTRFVNRRLHPWVLVLDEATGAVRPVRDGDEARGDVWRVMPFVQLCRGEDVWTDAAGRPWPALPGLDAALAVALCGAAAEMGPAAWPWARKMLAALRWSR